MATDIFTRAKAYRKKHPNVAWTDCVKAVAAGAKKAPVAKKKAATRKKAPVKKAPVKKKAAAVGKTKKAVAPRKVKVKIKPGKKGEASLSIGYPNRAQQWGKDEVRAHAKKLGLRVTHGYATEARRVSGISGVSMAELNRNLLHLQNLQKIEYSTKELLKDKQHKEAWPDLRRQLVKNKTAIASTKKHITALKRSI